jgi:hypothetical protein
VNTMDAEGIELDSQTVEQIERAAGKPVDIQVVTTTPAGNMSFLTVQASFEGDGMRFRLPGL